MVRGLIAGFVWGSLLSLVIAAALSLSAPSPRGADGQDAQPESADEAEEPEARVAPPEGPAPGIRVEDLGTPRVAEDAPEADEPAAEETIAQDEPAEGETQPADEAAGDEAASEETADEDSAAMRSPTPPAVETELAEAPSSPETSAPAAAPAAEAPPPVAAETRGVDLPAADPEPAAEQAALAPADAGTDAPDLAAAAPEELVATTLPTVADTVASSPGAGAPPAVPAPSDAPRDAMTDPVARPEAASASRVALSGGQEVEGPGNTGDVAAGPSDAAPTAAGPATLSAPAETDTPATATAAPPPSGIASLATGALGDPAPEAPVDTGLAAPSASPATERGLRPSAPTAPESTADARPAVPGTAPARPVAVGTSAPVADLAPLAPGTGTEIVLAGDASATLSGTRPDAAPQPVADPAPELATEPPLPPAAPEGEAAAREETGSVTSEPVSAATVTPRVLPRTGSPEGGAGPLFRSPSFPAIGTGAAGGQPAEDAPLNDGDPGPEVAAPDLPAIAAHAAAFTADPDRALLAVVLIHDSSAMPDPAALAALPVPLSFAVDPRLPEAGRIAAAYRAAGQEVVALASLLPAGLGGDPEAALSESFEALPEAVALLDMPDNRVQGQRATLEVTLAALGQTGHGLLAYPRGFNTAERSADRQGIPAATLFRALDGNGEGAAEIARILDRAALAAGQEGAAVVAGHARPETLAAVLEWALGGRSEIVTLAPVSAALQR